jgi:hypothetical protein
MLIKNNHIRDTSFSKINAYPFAIEITNEGLGHFEEIHLTGNTIENTMALAENMGGIRVQGKGVIDKVRIDDDNRFVNLKRQDLHLRYAGFEKTARIDQTRQ